MYTQLKAFACFIGLCLTILIPFACIGFGIYGLIDTIIVFPTFWGIVSHILLTLAGVMLFRMARPISIISTSLFNGREYKWF